MVDCVHRGEVASVERLVALGHEREQARGPAERLAAAFALAVDAGELDTAPDPALAAAHLIGPLVYRTTLQAAAVPDKLLAAVIDGVAHWRAPDPARSRPASATRP